MLELNRVLGGGVVPGSLILVGGDPGIGKSTLLLQTSHALAYKGIEGALYFRRRIRAANEAAGGSARGVDRQALCAV